MFLARLVTFISLLFIANTFANLPVAAYDFYGGLVTKASAWGFDTIELEVTESKKLKK